MVISKIFGIISDITYDVDGKDTNNKYTKDNYGLYSY